MRLYKGRHAARVLLYTCLLFLCLVKADKAMAYTDKPVLVHLNSLRQVDSFGFNIVKDLQKTFYHLILDNKIKLWDGPRKEKQITAQNLLNIEKNTKTKFLESQNIFFHEVWSSARRSTNFTIIGITFMNQIDTKRIPDPSRDPIYGYIDVFEVAAYLGTYYCDVNVNGPASLTLLDGLYSRKYHFNVVQFGKKDFKDNVREAIEVRNKAFFSKRRVEGIYKLPVTKAITYVIEQDRSESSEIGATLYNNIQQYINSNKEVVFNIGGNRYFDYATYKSDFVVTRIEVNEIWEKTVSGVVYHIESVTLYVHNKKLDPVSIETLSGWGILFNFKTIEDALAEKKFKYTLLTLNGNYLLESESEKYIKGLHISQIPWNQIKQYVKN